MKTRPVLSLVLLAACQSVVATSPGDDGSSSGDPVASTSEGTSAEDTTTAQPEPTGTTETSSASTSTSGAEGSSGPGVDSCAFLCDDTPSWAECDLYLQDCPAGEKCAPYANDGGSSWNDWACVPVDPSPVAPGEPCTVEGSGLTGVDSCAVGSMCWDVDPETNLGTCRAHCVGTEIAPACLDPEAYCTISGDGLMTLCLPSCNPLDPDTCSEGLGCYLFDDTFICIPDASGDVGGLLEPCEYANACDSGLQCVAGGEIASCDGPCCAPNCDLQAPQCPAGLTCVPYFDEADAPPGYAQLGQCKDPP